MQISREVTSGICGMHRTDAQWREPLSDVSLQHAAYETTANSLAFTLYMLARPENKSKVERLTAEIDAFGRNKVPTFEDLDKFPWLEVNPCGLL